MIKHATYKSHTVLKSRFNPEISVIFGRLDRDFWLTLIPAVKSPPKVDHSYSGNHDVTYEISRRKNSEIGMSKNVDMQANMVHTE
jgi:hypothetical protein